VTPTADRVRALAERLNEADTVTLFCGAGVKDAHAEVMALAEKLHSPIGHTLRGKEWIQYDNPYEVGMSGLLGYGACYEASHEADLLVLLGTDFPYQDFLPGARTVQVDHDPTRLGRRTPLELAVHGDVGATLRAVLPLVEQKHDRSFLDHMLHKHAEAARARRVGIHARRRAPSSDPPRVRGAGPRRAGLARTPCSPSTPA
jgi:pyruvate dehydrogenase (quinone)